MLKRDLGLLTKTKSHDRSASICPPKIVFSSMKTVSNKLRLPNPTQPLNCEWEGTVHSHFSEFAKRVPQKLAVIDAKVAWNYAELDANSNQLANYLFENGIQSQDIVAIYSHRSAALVWAILGVLKAGAAFVILDPAYPASRLINCLDIAQPRAWLQIETAGELPDALDEFVKTLSCCCSLVLSQSAIAVDGLLSGYSKNDPMVTVEPDNLLYIAFTSGSTGIPKGILGTHRPLSHFIKWHSQKFGFNESDRFSLLSGLAHDPLLRDIFTPLCLGATLCIPSQKDIKTPGKLADWMQEQQVSITHLTPPMAQLITNLTPTSRTANGDLTSLRYAFFGGDRLKKHDVHRLRTLAPHVTCVNFYGATETPQAMGYFIVPDSDESVDQGEPTNLNEGIPVGQGIQDVQLLVLNAQQLVEMGEVGEIYVRTPYLAKGYIGDQQLTQDRYITNPYTNTISDRLYKTGDLGRYLPDGNVECLGRIDNQVKIRGFRIEVGEIEAVLRKHPNLRETVVIAREDDLGNKRLVAYVVCEVIPLSELRQLIKDKLPDYMVPSAFVRLEALPLTPNGKIDRHSLPAPDTVRTELEETFVAPRTDLELQLTKIWEKVLGIQPIGIKDNFFELGGHSLLAIRLLTEIEKSFGKNLPLVTFFEAQTVEQLAIVLDKEDSQPWQTLVMMQPGTTKPPLFCIHAVWGNVFFYQKLVQYLGKNQPVYGLQAQGLDGKKPPLTSLTEMAAHYIQEIHTVQPNGPYHIGGFSFGGLLAFEIARQLQSQGQRIAMLAIFDTPAPGYHHVQASESEDSKLSQLLGRSFFHVGKLFKLSIKEQLTYLWERIWWHMKEGKLNFGYKFYLRYIMRSLQELRLLEISAANHQARDGYVAQAIPCQLTLFQATERPAGFDNEPGLGWGQLAKGGVECYKIPGMHADMMEEPQVKIVAEKLQYCLNHLQAD